jgi:pimeloyl-ACP methyl ester carboxylesterase
MPAARNTSAWQRFYEAYDSVLDHWPSDVVSRTVTTPSGTTQLHQCGIEGGEPVVLLHGMGATSVSWHAIAGALASNYQVIALDNIVDVNRSIPTRRHRKPEDLVEWLCDVMDALEVDRAHLVGCSYGGWLSMETALRRPKRVVRVGLVAPAATFAPIKAAFYLRVFPSVMLPIPWLGRSFMEWMRVGPPDPANPMLELLGRNFAITRGRNLSVPPPRVFTDEELASIEAPVLHLQGEHEVILDPEKAAERARRLVPRLESVTLPGTGHLIQAEKPEEVSRRLLDFLK